MFPLYRMETDDGNEIRLSELYDDDRLNMTDALYRQSVAFAAEAKTAPARLCGGSPFNLMFSLCRFWRTASGWRAKVLFQSSS